ncbi:hypothetical protein SB49_01305 [Sediminicola sp. YIK13]|uniref:nuclear transport factor 2 family protein n=1 Tax=Sediminicola sp. YIK13 TaxID=1453352 RepID=UPI00071F1369|nr:nuclear transport factor 2 family protein [Sediminicola sp. YIK13]ALM06599.1 hypothetical protein SB49_01305 [Sediminicola sp. YIK13]
MGIKDLVKRWFDLWESGDFNSLPIAENFKHSSPFGTIVGKKTYLELVATNKDKFLGHKFELHEALYGENRAGVRYTTTQGDFSMEVSEWYYVQDNLILEIIAYYHIGEIREERKLSFPNKTPK